MHKKLLVISLLSGIVCTSQAYSNHDATMISHELGQINQTLINNQPAIERNINTAINSIQRILNYNDPYDHIEQLDQHFMNLEAAIEGGCEGDKKLKAQCKANLSFLRKLLQRGGQRSSTTNLVDRLSKLGTGTLNGLFGALFAGYAALGIESLINKRDIDLLVFFGTGNRYASADAGIVINPSKIESGTTRAFSGIPFLIYAGLSTPFLYFAAKALKRGIFFNTHLQNRENCIKEYAQREQELEKNLAHVLN